MHWFTTFCAAALQVVFNTTQGILGVLVSSSNLSLYGLFLTFVTGLFLCYFLAACCCAVIFRDPLVFLIADEPAERNVFRYLRNKTVNFGSRLTLAQWMMCLAAINTTAAITSWYATPSERTPPVIQAIMQSVPVITAIPCSKYVLGDRKRYTQTLPLIGIGLIIGSIIISLVPGVVAGGDQVYSGSAANTIGWTLMCLLSQVPTGCALVCQQAFLIRAGAVAEGVTRKHAAKVMLRMLMYNQVIVLFYAGIFWWVDILPWFGTSDSPATFATGTAYSFECAVLGPSGVQHVPPGLGGASSCTPHTPLYALTFVLAYVGMLVSVTVLNTESAVFNTLCFVFNTAAQAVFWLIPGTNPSGDQHAPLWSTITALVLSLAGVIVFKKWEAGIPLDQQFDIVGSSAGACDAGVDAYRQTRMQDAKISASINASGETVGSTMDMEAPLLQATGGRPGSVVDWVVAGEGKSGWPAH